MEFQINQIDNQIEDEQYYEQKYLKYKLKYLTLKEELNDVEGGVVTYIDETVRYYINGIMPDEFPGMIIRTKEEIKHEEEYNKKGKYMKMLSASEYPYSTKNQMIKIADKKFSRLITAIDKSLQYENIHKPIIEMFKEFNEKGFLNPKKITYTAINFGKEPLKEPVIRYLWKIIKWKHYFDKIPAHEVKGVLDETDPDSQNAHLIKLVKKNGWVNRSEIEAKLKELKKKK
jgi:hypothetical protein